MILLRTFALLYVLAATPLLAYIVIDLWRGAGDFIKPYLFASYGICSFLAAVLLALAMFVWPSTRKQSAGRTIFLTLGAMLLCLFFIGIGQVVAESIAASAWERSGRPLGDHGSYREFYPGDSGMAHWPTPWYVVPMLGCLTSLVWGPFAALFLLCLHWLECLLVKFFACKEPRQDEQYVSLKSDRVGG